MIPFSSKASCWGSSSGASSPASGCPPLRSLMERYAAAGGRYLVCPICFDAKGLDKGDLTPGAELGGTVPMWNWIGDEGAVTFSY
jgi:hypothetical protein